MTRYTIRTDAVLCEVEAESIDAAAAQFARDEGLSGGTVDEVFRSIAEIDGAWMWIEGDSPDGARRSIGRP